MNLLDFLVITVRLYIWNIVDAAIWFISESLAAGR